MSVNEVIKIEVGDNGLESLELVEDIKIKCEQEVENFLHLITNGATTKIITWQNQDYAFDGEVDEELQSDVIKEEETFDGKPIIGEEIDNRKDEDFVLNGKQENLVSEYL